MQRKYEYIDLVGQKIGAWKVLKRAARKTKNSKTVIYFECECECGTKKEILSANLRRGVTKSCGCKKFQSRLKEAHSRWRGYEEIPRTYLGYLERGAFRRNLKYNIDAIYLWELFIKQDRKCALTGLPIKFESTYKKFDGTASVDRIDSSVGYEMGNVQWVHKDVNWLKGNFPQEEFFNLCELVTKNRK